MPIGSPLGTFFAESRKRAGMPLVADLDALPPDAPRVLLSTGKLVGEGYGGPRF
jgi:hypothetical protein